MFMEAQFGDCVSPLEPSDDDEMLEKAYEHHYPDPEVRKWVPGIKITIDSMVAKVRFDTLEVESANRGLRDRVKSVVERAVETVAPFVDLVGVYS